jgi:hypothetical protein
MPKTEQTKDKHLSHRVSAETLRQLEELSARWGSNNTETVIRCIERTYTAVVCAAVPKKKRRIPF